MSVTQPGFFPSLSVAEWERYVTRLLANYLPDGIEADVPIARYLPEALERLEHCFSRINRKYYNVDGVVAFDHLNGDHVAAFLYLLANTIWKRSGTTAVPTRLFYLNKAMHGLDLFFSVELPPVFLLVHPVGTVIGNAQYGDYFTIYQNCTVGADAGVYPTFGKGVVLFSRSSVLGASVIGDDVVIAANSFVINAAVASSSIVVGQYPQHRVLPNPIPVRTRIFDPA